MMPTARVLANVVDQLDGIDMADSDTTKDSNLGTVNTTARNALTDKKNEKLKIRLQLFRIPT